MRFATGRQIQSGLLLLCGVLMASGLTFHAVTQPLDSFTIATPPAKAANIQIPEEHVASPVSDKKMLVLYDDHPIDEFSQPAELAAIHLVNLLGHFGSIDHATTSDYTAGSGNDYDLVAYISSIDTKPVPQPILQDFLSGDFTALWIGYNANQLVEADDSFVDQFGWQFQDRRRVPVDEVFYKGEALPRPNQSNGVHTVTINDRDLATPYGVATWEGRSQGAWAVRSRHLTFVGENPFDLQERADRSLVLADLLFDLLAPDREVNHQALVRIEDVGPWADPQDLRDVADVLHELDVPFSVAVYPQWEDPKQAYELESKIRLADRPEVVEALLYMVEKGGTLLMHGLTHQFGEEPNPYQGVSGEDYEFVSAQIDEDGNVEVVGPVPGDSTEWMQSRVTQSFAEFADAGLPEPTIFEFSHYAGSAVDYRAITDVFEARFDQGVYYIGHLSDEPADYSADAVAPIVPYPIFDGYGEYVLPENLGNVVPIGSNNNEAISPADIVDNANRSLAVRDNVAGFFFHPYLDVDQLLEIVTGIQEGGYTFVSTEEALNTWIDS